MQVVNGTPATTISATIPRSSSAASDRFTSAMFGS
jgi:hypothetical protein